VVLKKLRVADLTNVTFGTEAGASNSALEIIRELDNEPDQRDLNITGKHEDTFEKKDGSSVRGMGRTLRRSGVARFGTDAP
jgi:hypothetical protein